jgi:hypothetical protein
MDLENFVSETLIQIINGVRAAQSATANTGAKINMLLAPSTLGDTPIESPSVPIERVDFDIAVTATEGEGRKGGINVVAGVFGAKGQVESHALSSSVSRVRFGVGLMLPIGT